MVKNISIDSNSGQADSNNTDKKCLRGASCGMENYEYSDRMLEAMQTSVVFFDPEGIVYRVNSLACRDLKIEKNPEYAYGFYENSIQIQCVLPVLHQ